MISSFNSYDYDNNNSLSAVSNLTSIDNSTSSLNSIDFTFGRIFLVIFLIALEFLTIFGNLLVLLSIFVDFHLRTPSHFLMGSLAIADLMLGLLVLPFSSLQLYFDRWLFNDLFCEIWISCDVLCSTASIYLVTVISIDRYISITRPLRYTTIMTRRRVYLMITFAWILSLLVSLARLIGFKSPEQTSVHRLCEMSDNFSYALGSAALSYYIPLVVILFVYYKIFRLARAHMKFIKKSKTTLNSNNNNVKNGEVNIKLLEYNKNVQNNINETNHKDINNNNNNNNNNKELIIKNEFIYCRCKRSKKNDYVDQKLFNPKFNRIKANQIKKIDKTTMQLANRENNYLSSSSSFSSSKSLSLTSSTKREICEYCKKYISTSLSSRVIDLKNQNGSINNYFVVTSSTVSSTKPKLKNGISKTTIILNFVRRLAKLKTEQKAAKTLGIVVGCLILCWAPFFIISPLDAFCRSCQIPKIIFTIFVWLGYCNSAMNPLIYCLSSKEFRK